MCAVDVGTPWSFLPSRVYVVVDTQARAIDISHNQMRSRGDLGDMAASGNALLRLA